jgi:hypothetical protein
MSIVAIAGTFNMAGDGVVKMSGAGAMIGKRTLKIPMRSYSLQGLCIIPNRALQSVIGNSDKNEFRYQYFLFDISIFAIVFIHVSISLTRGFP